MIPAKFLLLMGAAALAACSSDPHGPHIRRGGEAPTYTNPVMARDFPDPAVIRAPDGFYYAYATQSRTAAGIANIQVARSRDLVRWEHLGDALPEKPRWASRKQEFWAPHVIHDRQRDGFHMYYSAEPDDARGKCLAVATAASPRGPFADSGRPLLCGEGIEHIDPMAFDDPRTGKRLLYWGSGGMPLQVQELAPDRARFLEGSAPAQVAFPDKEKEYRALIEGAWVSYRDGAYFLYYSGDRCCGPRAKYAVMVARSASAFGPFAPLDESGGVILRENARWRAPGHNSVVTDEAGDDWILYHAYAAAPAPGEEEARMLLIDRIDYRDGWPGIGDGTPSTAPRPAPAAGWR